MTRAMGSRSATVRDLGSQRTSCIVRGWFQAVSLARNSPGTEARRYGTGLQVERGSYVMQKPEGAHDIICYHCGHKIMVGGRAQSTSCPGCHKRVMIEDIVVKAYQAVLSLETCGKLIVPKGGQVVAQQRV